MTKPDVYIRLSSHVFQTITFFLCVQKFMDTLGNNEAKTGLVGRLKGVRNSRKT